MFLLLDRKSVVGFVKIFEIGREEALALCAEPIFVLRQALRSGVRRVFASNATKHK